MVVVLPYSGPKTQDLIEICRPFPMFSFDSVLLISLHPSAFPHTQHAKDIANFSIWHGAIGRRHAGASTLMLLKMFPYTTKVLISVNQKYVVYIVSLSCYSNNDRFIIETCSREKIFRLAVLPEREKELRTVTRLKRHIWTSQQLHWIQQLCTSRSL